MWRSNRQPITSLSPTESEIYALSVSVKDVRLMGWALEELGVAVRGGMQRRWLRREEPGRKFKIQFKALRFSKF